MREYLYIAALVAIGMLLILVEIIVPGFGVAAALAIIAMVAAVWWAFTISTAAGVIVLAAVLVLVPAWCVLLVRRLPNSALGKRIFLRSSQSAEGESFGQAEDLAHLVGKQGTSLTVLRPAGAIRLDGKRHNAIAESGFIESGQLVKVIRFDGIDLVVRKVSATPSEVAAGGQ